MPIYTYQCESCEQPTDEFRAMDARDEPGTCKCGGATARIFNPCGNRATIREYGQPIEMMSVAVDNDSEIRSFRERNPGIEISSDRRSPNYGIPIARSRQEKLSILRAEGFVENN